MYLRDKMLVEVLKSKIHGAVVTECNVDYTGSITLDAALIDAAGIFDGEKVLVGNLDNGNRFTTYVVSGERNSGIIGVNGAAAKLTKIGDRVIIMSFCLVDASEVEKHASKIIIVDEKNRINV